MFSAALPSLAWNQAHRSNVALRSTPPDDYIIYDIDFSSTFLYTCQHLLPCNNTNTTNLVHLLVLHVLVRYSASTFGHILSPIDEGNTLMQCSPYSNCKKYLQWNLGAVHRIQTPLAILFFLHIFFLHMISL